MAGLGLGGNLGLPPLPKEISKLAKGDFAKGIGAAAISSLHPTEDDTFYAKVNPDSWYKTYPYRFTIYINGALFKSYALPIPPEVLTIRPVYASDAIPTLGGVIEECSAVTFWQISMAGTMPHGVLRAESEIDRPAKIFREALSSTGLVTSVLSGIAQPVMSLLARGQNVYNAASQGWKTGVTGGLAAALQPPLPYNQSGVSSMGNGYVEIHRMQKFFLWYEAFKSRFSKQSKNFNGSSMELYFENVKDGQKFRVIPKQTDFAKTAAAPYTYKYNMVLLGWDIQPQGKSSKDEVNRFRDGDLKTVNTLSHTSILTGVKNASSKIKKGLTNPLGTFTSVPPIL